MDKQHGLFGQGSAQCCEFLSNVLTELAHQLKALVLECMIESLHLGDELWINAGPKWNIEWTCP